MWILVSSLPLKRTPSNFCCISPGGKLERKREIALLSSNSLTPQHKITGKGSYTFSNKVSPLRLVGAKGIPMLGCCCCLVAQLCLTLRPHELQSARLLCPWDIPGRNTGVGCISFFRRSSRGLNPCLQHWQADSWPLSHQGSLCAGIGLFDSHILSASSKHRLPASPGVVRAPWFCLWKTRAVFSHVSCLVAAILGACFRRTVSHLPGRPPVSPPPRPGLWCCLSAGPSS